MLAYTVTALPCAPVPLSLLDESLARYPLDRKQSNSGSLLQVFKLATVFGLSTTASNATKRWYSRLLRGQGNSARGWQGSSSFQLIRSVSKVSHVLIDDACQASHQTLHHTYRQRLSGGGGRHVQPGPGPTTWRVWPFSTFNLFLWRPTCSALPHTGRYQITSYSWTSYGAQVDRLQDPRVSRGYCMSGRHESEATALRI